VKNIEQTAEEIYTLMPSTEREEDLVFSHMDFEYRNVLLDNSNYNKLHIVDFNSNLGFRGLDIAIWLHWGSTNLNNFSK
jgi:thiamine kinase-like enzyme